MEILELYLWGSIDHKLSYKLIRKLKQLKDTKKCIIFINSVGGDVEQAWAIVDQINLCVASGILVATVAHGPCYSAASLILSQGQKPYRFATLNSAIMMHPTKCQPDEDYYDKQFVMIKFTKKQEERCDRVMAAACNKDIKDFRKHTRNALWLLPDEAIKYGVIDGIWRGTI